MRCLFATVVLTACALAQECPTDTVANRCIETAAYKYVNASTAAACCAVCAAEAPTCLVWVLAKPTEARPLPCRLKNSTKPPTHGSDKCLFSGQYPPAAPTPAPPTPAPAPTPPTPPTPVPNPWPYVLNSEFRDANCAEPLGPSPSVTPTDVCAPGKDGTSWRKSACSPTGTLYYQYTYDNADCSGTPVTFTGNTGECYQNQAYTFSEFKCSATNSTAAAASV